MKIAQIVCVYPPYRGGIGTSALETARVLSSAGNEVKTFTLTDGQNTSESEEVVRLKAVLKSGNGGLLPQLFRRLNGFDLVYLHYPFFGAAEIIWLLKKFAWKNKTKLIIHFHMEPEFSSPLLKILSLPSRLIAPSLFQEADLIICASRDYAEANMPAKIWHDNQDKIREIPFSVDTERFKPAEAAQSRENFKILFVGGLDKAHYFKGVDVLLDSLSLLAKNNQAWQAEIVGGGDLRPQYENQARELGIADKIIFSGKASDKELPKKYQQADCLVLPSVNRGEAFGIVLLEAMASGIPVIATDLPGVRKVFTDGAEGLLAKPGDARDLQNKIKFLMENPAKRQAMGEAARELAEEKYSRNKISDKLIGILVN
ncbi:MAG: glycosyltransferase family 4 protein [Patescibacteria group bacterium]|nr:glycosyltransferase family 4 protein [Patescibacteria group bacterium]